MTDLIQRIEAYMLANPYASRTQIEKSCNVNLKKLKKLEAEGHIKLPLKQTASIGGTKSRKVALRFGKNFTMRSKS